MLHFLSTNRFSLGHVPIQPSTKDREVDLFIEPAARIEMFIYVPSVNGKDCIQFAIVMLSSNQKRAADLHLLCIYHTAIINYYPVSY